MTGFSADWLALREPADHRARHAATRDRVVAHLGRLARPEIIDLGCGSGSNLRALAPHLGARQGWRLVDNDPALLDAARAALTLWADAHRADAAGGLTLEKNGKIIDVAFRRVDLSRDAESLLDEGCDLVTAAALFDLVSQPWLDRFIGALAMRNAPLYAVLTYNGVERWAPAHSDDAAMLEAFHVHQGGDKGFGPAAGPDAPALLRAAFEELGWDIHTGDSPWRLGPGDAPLIAALAEGAADAVAETGLVPAPTVADWRASRGVAASCVIGHSDLFALPPGPAD